MDIGRIVEALEKLPIVPLLMAFVGYMGWNYWGFVTAPDSPFKQREAQRAAIIGENEALERKIEEGKRFYATLEQKRNELRTLAKSLDEMKATLADTLDTGALIKAIVTEADRVGLVVRSIRPTGKTGFDYYEELSFDLDFRSVYIQLVLFLERLASLERIFRVEDIHVSSRGPTTAPYVDLEGKITVRAYRYLGSKADEVARSGGSATLPTPSGGGAGG